MSVIRRRALLAVLLATLLAASGCATIPLETHPQVVGKDSAQDVEEDPDSAPASGLSPDSIVRQFVHSNAQPVNDYGASRVYLDEGSRESWRPGEGTVILEDSFDAIEATESEQPADPNKRVIKVRGTIIGTLGADSAFTPADDSFDAAFLLHRQGDGQWRIVDPPGEVITTTSDFGDNYVKMQLYFFAPGSQEVLVPDIRYVRKKPQPGLPARVVELLLGGPSIGLRNAVDDPLARASTKTNVTTSPDGALLVPLDGGVDEDPQARTRMAAQIVLSLQGATTSRIRILVDGARLLPDREDWRPGDLPSYAASVSPAADLPGMMVVGNRLLSLGTGKPIPGPAGLGAYRLISAAQSVPGGQLALVERTAKGMRLRVGSLTGDAQIVPLSGTQLTRPTWRPVEQGNEVSHEVWTVKDGDGVVRVLLTAQGSWRPQRVNTDDIEPIGRITALRLSRDGTRVAIVAGRKLVVASVLRQSDSVSLSGPRTLQPAVLTDVVDVDWVSQDTLVAATSSATRPVVKVSVDGYRLDPFNRSNLTPPVHAIAAAPGRSVVAADDRGLWTASEVGALWSPHERKPGADTWPFYPG